MSDLTLAVASYVSTEDRGGGALHEVHPERLFAECSHYCGLVSHPSQISWLAGIAMQHALARGGVAVLLLDPPVATERRNLARAVHIEPDPRRCDPLPATTHLDPRRSAARRELGPPASPPTALRTCAHKLTCWPVRAGRGWACVSPAFVS